MTEGDAAWVAAVRVACEPVLEAADVGFALNDSASAEGRALLWEADPRLFGERFPAAGLLESYGETSYDALHCVDWWVHLDQPGTARLELEGADPVDVTVPLTGDGVADGARIAEALADALTGGD